MATRDTVPQAVMDALGAGAEPAVARCLERYAGPSRRLHDLAYLRLGFREHLRLMGGHPPRLAAVAWLWHAWEDGDEGASAVELLRDAKGLGLTLEEADDKVAPLILGSRPSLPSSSVVGDMRLAVLGQEEKRYAAYARKVRLEWRRLGVAAVIAGRAAALKELMARKPLYFKEEFEGGLAERARRNMAKELSSLGFPPPPEAPDGLARIIDTSNILMLGRGEER